MSVWAELITKVFEFLTELLKRTSTKDNIDRIVAIYDAMKAIINVGLAHRVLVVKVENSGGVIKPGVPIYASAIHEDYDPRRLSAFKDEYQRVLVDKTFVTILAGLLQSGYSDLFTIKLEDGFIKDFYEAQKIKYAEWYLLHKTKKVIIFLTIVTTDPVDVFDNPYQRNCINIQVNKIRNAISGKKIKT